MKDLVRSSTHLLIPKHFGKSAPLLSRAENVFASHRAVNQFSRWGAKFPEAPYDPYSPVLFNHGCGQSQLHGGLPKTHGTQSGLDSGGQ